MVQRKRVVVTGMGVLTALGNTLEAFREGLFAEKAAIGPSQHFRHYFDDALASEVLQPVEYPGIDPQRPIRQGTQNAPDDCFAKGHFVCNSSIKHLFLAPSHPS